MKEIFVDNETEAPRAGLSRKAMKDTEDFIQTNSGNTEAFRNNSIAYDNSVEIESSKSNRQKMMDIVNQDNGKGGTSPANNREYGGNITNGVVREDIPGAVTSPLEYRASIALTIYPQTSTTFHSHPSGILRVSQPSGTLGQITEHHFQQFPSHYDFEDAQCPVNYVFGRGDGNVYIYNKQAVQAIISQKFFIDLNRNR